MATRDRDRFRKYESGASKARKRNLREEFDKTQAGALDKYIRYPKEVGKQQKNVDLVVDSNVANVERNKKDYNESTTICGDDSNNESSRHLLSAANPPNFDNRDKSSGLSENDSGEDNSFPMIVKDIYDPGNWEHMSNALRSLLLEKGPIRLPDDHDYPIDMEKRHFSRNFYIRKMPNKECVDRRWLVYSQIKDAAFCFCCKLYGKSSAGKLSNGVVMTGDILDKNWKNMSFLQNILTI
ncbi:zinc finger MYM-type protein 5-like [Physella acuta]|uniref:zinc finger MYM-type protein 5-like n=1 Tax=Physella acuta TaxID=109671 RepID=UPI0027DE5A03|nr:zinc finger MYM-type protein 5-like [Physella acuta]